MAADFWRGAEARRTIFRGDEEECRGTSGCQPNSALSKALEAHVGSGGAHRIGSQSIGPEMREHAARMTVWLDQYCDLSDAAIARRYRKSKLHEGRTSSPIWETDDSTVPYLAGCRSRDRNASASVI